MREFAKRLYTEPRYAKAIEFCKLITITGSAQIIVQAIGLISGILVIRLLPTQEYALYTLTNTMLGTMTVLADGGISTGVMGQGGKVWQDSKKLGVVIATGLHLRRKYAIGSLLIATPILLYLLRRHGAGWLETILIILSLIPAFLAALSDTLLEVAPKLRQDIYPLQKNQVSVNVGRLAMLALTLFVFPWTSIAVLCSGIPRIWGNYRLRKITHRYADWNQAPDPVVQKEISAVVKRMLPGAIYYCLSGQITIWIISIFGSTFAVAQVGALGRLAMVLTVFSMLFGTLISPRFARLQNNSKLLLKRFIQIQIGFFILSTFIIFLVNIFSSQILWVLGKDYAGFSYELILSITGSCISLIAGLNFGLFTSRGWAINPFISIPVEVVCIVVGALFINVSSIRGIFIFNIFIATVQMLMNASYCLIKILKANKEMPVQRSL